MLKFLLSIATCSIFCFQVTADEITELDAMIEQQLMSDQWHASAAVMIRSQWNEYKKAHEKPGMRGDFYGAECYGGITCASTLKNYKQLAGEYIFKSDDSEKPNKAQLKIEINNNDRAFVIEGDQRYPAFINRNIVFYTDGTITELKSPLGNKSYGHLNIRVIYKAAHFGWVTGDVNEHIDDMLKLEKLK